MIEGDPHPRKEDRYKTQYHDIGDILGKHGATPSKREYTFGSELQNFFHDADISPNSQVGEFVRIHAIEHTMQSDLADYTLRHLRKGDPSPKALEGIERKKEDLNIIREVRKTIGREAFGDEKSAEYAKRVEDVLFGHQGRLQHDKARRAELKQGLLDEIKKRFPSASE